jgi:hypothetical protein
MCVVEMNTWVVFTFIVIAASYWRYRRHALKLAAHTYTTAIINKKLQAYTRTVDIIHTTSLLPGEVVTRDLRSDETKRAANAFNDATSDASSSPPTPTPTPSLRVLNYNIERGFKLPQLIRELRALQPVPDVILLQEVDIDCKRTANVDVAGELAAALDMQYVVAVDMIRVNVEDENDPNAPKSHDPKDFKDNYEWCGRKV